MLVAAVLVAYPLVSLWPLEFGLPQHLTNGAQVLPGGGLRFAAPGLALSAEAPDWIDDAQRAGRVELSLRLRTAEPLQLGPARILTLSLSRYRRDLTIEQDVADLIVRLRTEENVLNGRNYRLPGLFRTAGWIDLDIRVESGLMLVTVDGEERVHKALPAAPLEAWDPSCLLALGNEPTGEFPWLGEIERAVVTAGDVTTDYAAAGVLERPQRFWYFPTFPKLMPFRDGNLADALQNVLMYVPLGFVLARRSRSAGRWGGLRSWALVFAVSASLEALQLLVPVRCTSADDLIFNTLGGGCGILLGLRREPRRS